MSGRRDAKRVAAAAAVLLAIVAIVAIGFGLRGSAGPPAPPDGGLGAVAASPVSPSSSSDLPTPSGSVPIATPSTSGTADVSPAPSDTTYGGAATSAGFGPFLAASAPVRIDIPSVGIHSSTFVDLRKAADGTITVPGSADEVGFYDAGPSPGQLGPAVIAAHVDSFQGPGVFYTLGSIKPGDSVSIGRADGSTLKFTVDAIRTYPKSEFPTDAVYHSDFTHAELRLVTCGGGYDPVNSYHGNVVVFAHLVG